MFFPLLVSCFNISCKNSVLCEEFHEKSNFSRGRIHTRIWLLAYEILKS
jgi:hypothetical protein